MLRLECFNRHPREVNKANLRLFIPPKHRTDSLRQFGTVSFVYAASIDPGIPKTVELRLLTAFHDLLQATALERNVQC